MKKTELWYWAWEAIIQYIKNSFFTTNDRKSNLNWFKHPNRRDTYWVIYLKTSGVNYSSVFGLSRVQMMSWGSQLSFSLSVNIGVSLTILLSSIFYLLSHVQYTWESQLQSSNSPGLLSYCFEWTAINIHLYWSLCKIPDLILIAFDWLHISLPEPTSLGKVEFNALLARPV